MSLVVALDAGPLGLVTNPKRSPESLACAQWLQALVAAGARVVLPEIADYEIRRELLRGRRVTHPATACGEPAGNLRFPTPEVFLRHTCRTESLPWELSCGRPRVAR